MSTAGVQLCVPNSLSPNAREKASLKSLLNRSWVATRSRNGSHRTIAMIVTSLFLRSNCLGLILAAVCLMQPLKLQVHLYNSDSLETAPTNAQTTLAMPVEPIGQ